MQAVYHDIRTLRIGRCRKIRMKPEMRSVSLIHDQRQTLFMNSLCNSRHIRNHPVISGGHDHNRLCLRMPLQSLPYILRRYPGIQPRLRIKFRIQVQRSQSLHLNGMIHGLVAISCHKYRISSVRASKQRAQNPCCAPIYQKMRLLRPEHFGRTLLRLL